jgi:guanylate kinase
MGQLAGVDVLRTYPCRWLDVLLWCPRDETERRLRGRGSEDVSRRLTAWEETLAELRETGDEPRFALSLRTDRIAPTEAAAVINALVQGQNDCQ